MSELHISDNEIAEFEGCGALMTTRYGLMMGELSKHLRHVQKVLYM